MMSELGLTLATTALLSTAPAIRATSRPRYRSLVFVIAQGRGGLGYLVEEHPLLMIVGVAVLLALVWLFLRVSR